MTRHLSEFDLSVAWLAQFAGTDRAIASDFLDSLNLISATAFHKALTRLLEFILSADAPFALYAVRELQDEEKYFPDKGRKPLTILPGPVGSEGLIASILTKLAEAHPNALDHPPIRTLRKRAVENIVLVDDVSVTGARLEKFLRALMTETSLRSWASRGWLKFHVLAYLITPRAKGRISAILSRWTRMAREHRLDFHVHEASSSGYRSLDETLLQGVERICAKYPATLPRSELGARYGYGKALATLVFQHGCPNNVPAMLWTTAADWQPLFPARRIPGALLPAFGAERPSRTDRLTTVLSVPPSQSVHRDAADIVNVLSALRRRRLRESELTHATGIGTLSVRLILDRCKRFGLIGSDGRTSLAGRAEIRRLARTIEREEPLVSNEQAMYRPTALRGSRDRI